MKKGRITPHPVKISISRFKQAFQNRFFNLSSVMRLNILAVFVGVVGGFGSWFFRIMISFIYTVLYILPHQLLAGSVFSDFYWLPFLVSPILGGIIVGILTSRVSIETKGHGVPEVLEAVALHDGKMRLKVPFVKIIASATTIGSGGSAGREGPIAQIGAGFASLIGQKLDLGPSELRTLVVSGVCAGISATFNAPIGGALFGLEVIRRETSISQFIPLIVSSVVGTVVGQLLLGTNPAFENFPPFEYHDPTFVPLFIILAIILGFGSALWIKVFYKLEDIFENLFKKFRIPDFLQAALGGLCVGLILLITFIIAGDQWETYTTMGRTYMPMDAVFNDSLTTGILPIVLLVLIALFILKVISTTLTIGTGGSGGVFAPTLFLGVMLGAIFGVIVRDVFQIPGINVAVFALLGMAGFFAGTGRAPLTAIIMTAELTGDYFLMIPLMFVVSISWLVAGRLESEDIYVRKLTRRGIKIEEPLEDLLSTIKVSEVMTPREQLVTLDIKTRLETVLEIIRTTKHEGFPVFDQDQFVGVITRHDIQQALYENPKNWNVGDVMENKPKHIICVDADANLAHVIGIMVRRDISRLPVVEKCDSPVPKLIGWISHHDITQAYMTKQAKQALDELERHVLSYPTHQD
ncbi:MAG: chloride channel protein [Candidatus Hermodarchaeota archaeon]